MRRIYSRATSQGGGRQRISPLLQIFQVLYRRSWCSIRSSLETANIDEKDTILRNLKKNVTVELFYRVDKLYEIENPERDVAKYIGAACENVFKRQCIEKVTLKAVAYLANK